MNNLKFFSELDRTTKICLLSFGAFLAAIVVTWYCDSNGIEANCRKCEVVKMTAGEGEVTEHHRLAEAVCDLVNAPHSEHVDQNGNVTSVTIPWPLYRELKERYNSLLDELRRN